MGMGDVEGVREWIEVVVPLLRLGCWYVGTARATAGSFDKLLDSASRDETARPVRLRSGSG
jgi:hypothetical protein